MKNKEKKREKVKLSIIILNYNSKDFLKRCLVSIIDSNDCLAINSEVIVVDNGSTDQSLEEIKNLNLKNSNLKLKIVENNKNLGFARGNNVGIKKAKGDYFLFLNPDTVIQSGAIKGALKFLENNPLAGAVTVKLVMANGMMDEACHRGFPTPWNALCHFLGLEKIFPKSRFFSGYILGDKLLDFDPHEVDACSGAFMLVRKSVGKKLGWWDESYFWYGEDLDFCYRIKKEGYKIFFLPMFEVIHFRGVTSGIKDHSRLTSSASIETKIRSARASTEAMRIFYRKHYLDLYPKIITWLVMGAIKFVEVLRVGKIKITNF